MDPNKDLEFLGIHSRKRKTIVANPKICAGCRMCEMICSLSHEGCIDMERSRIHIMSNPFRGSFVPKVCHQCSNAPCYYACPSSAIEVKKDLGGIVMIDEEKCTGCRECVDACPYNAIRFDQDRNKVLKCDFCNGDPECVKWCPVNALGVAEFGGGHS